MMFGSTRPLSRLEIGTATSIGRMRSNNEDAYLVANPLFAVADGMGGHEAGEIASTLAVDTLRAAKADLTKADNLRALVVQANITVLDAPTKGIGRLGMGTTLTAAVIDNDRLLIAQVGDSRAYLLHDDQLRRLTKDHSYVQELLNSGEITEAESRDHPRRGVITRVLGFESHTQPDLYELRLAEGDRVLLCSDGLHGMLEDKAIQKVLQDERTAQQCADALVRAANKAGGADNTTVIVIDVMTIAPVRHNWLSQLSLGLRTANPEKNDKGPSEDSSKRLPATTAFSVRRGVLAFLIAFVLLVGSTCTGIYLYAANSAYVIAENGHVILYRGLVGDVFGFKLQWEIEDTGIVVDDLYPPLPERLRQGIQLKSLSEAEQLVEQYREQVEGNTSER